ncbi:unnamed protein product [Kluyveromyces dobzhanskii CBS 2104]|uniref:WGS project CCBQ000000000 data, contig 00014 n=1 Tax=Kluyveromyces dobzhanskii CBS 2104 TaxID=1427455 RepID=A0A0A8L935_9SACH|nr:unnamed protein product [Kluyveromyces dobzhanskii CBS 2104]
MTTTQPFKKAKKVPNYRIPAFTSVPTHPLGVKPSGNALIEGADPKEIKQVREKLLGSLAVLPEDVLIELITYIDDPKDLQSLGCSSRILYAYTYDEELWRRNYTKEYLKLESEKPEQNHISPFGCTEWKGSWRKTVLKLDDEALIQCHGTLFSDTLYRPYQCSQIDYTELFKKVIEFEKSSYELGTSLNSEFGVPRMQESEFDMKTFHEQYINKPFILQNKNAVTPEGKPRWPKWTLEDLLERFPHETFRQEAVKWDLSLYAHYFKENRDESPLYLFDCNSIAIKAISKEFTPPAIYRHDFFKLFQESGIKCRPDHRWLIAGPARSGSTFHKDPNHTSAWNTGLSGMKLWIMLPPGENPPGVMTDQEEEEVTSPVGIAEWVISGYYNDAVKLAQQGKCQICVTFPDECIYVPSGWWHSVINLTDSVALTENFVPEPIVPKVMNFFKNKPTQLSGFHLKDFVESVRVFMEKHATSDTLEGRLKTLKHFVENSEKYNLDNEDCGVLDTKELHPPIYEFFVELISDSKYSDKLGEFITKMKDIELTQLSKESSNASVRESEAWNQLTKESSEGFSFGFSFEE